MPIILRLLLSFLKIGLFSIGGGYATIPLIEEQVVNLHGWLNLQEFTDIITISQMTPGPLAVNTSTFVGIRTAGIPGAVIATFGCVFSGFCLSILLYRFFEGHQESTAALRVLGGLRAASAGLIAASAGTIVLLALTGASTLSLAAMQVNFTAMGLFAASLFALRKWKLNPLIVMLITGVAGVFLYR